MSVSSHLTPDPERRLWVIHEDIYKSLEWTDMKLGALTAFAAGQMAVIRFITPESAPGLAALAALCAALPAGILGCSPFIETLRPIPLLDARENKPRTGDSPFNAYDLARYSQLELTNFLDRYLGGGITATPYYEDIVAKIVIGARIAARKRRLFAGVCVLATAAQLCLLVQLFRS